MTKFGAIIMTAFATIWWVVGIHLAPSSSPLLYGVAVAFGLLVTTMAIRAPTPNISADEQSRRGRLVGIASAVEGAAIFLVANILANIGRSDLTAAATAIIVGIHFLPLAWRLPASLYYVTGASLFLLGVGGCFPSRTHLVPSVVCLAAAAILWATSALVLRVANSAAHSGAGAA